MEAMHIGDNNKDKELSILDSSITNQYANGKKGIDI